MGPYDVALICLNGHSINAGSRRSPEFNTSFCTECGQPTIDACPECKEPIRGYHEEDMGLRWTVPKTLPQMRQSVSLDDTQD